MITIREIAAKAGVSKSTVSLALRRDPACSAKTVERIHRLANKMGYRPNPLVTANMANMRLGEGRKNIQSILAYFYDHSRGLPYKLKSFIGASERARELGFELEAFPYNDPEFSSKRLLKILRHRNVQGILIGESRTPIYHIEFNWAQFAVAAIGYTLQSPHVDRVGFDHTENMAWIFQDLNNRKYKRVGLALRSDFDDRTSHLPTASYLSYRFEEHRADPLPLYVERENWNETSFFNWYDRNKPDCIITQGNEIGTWLASRKIRIPHDVGVFSIWGEAEEQVEDYSHFNVSLELLSKTAINVISDQLNSNSRGVPQQRRSILISSELVDRKSLRPPEI
jgi:LacI family transcriptional regulator